MLSCCVADDDDDRHGLPQDTALFYFAGHGIEAPVMQGSRENNGNWLLASEIPSGNDELPLLAVDAHALLKELEGQQPRFSVMILDCCRDNPLPAVSRSLSSGGLGVMSPNGSYIAFACAAGQKAADNPKEPHGLYTKHLLKHIEKGQRVEDLFIEVNNAVRAESKTNPTRFKEGEQVPWTASSLRVSGATL